MTYNFLSAIVEGHDFSPLKGSLNFTIPKRSQRIAREMKKDQRCHVMAKYVSSGWWQLEYLLIFIPNLGEDNPIRRAFLFFSLEGRVAPKNLGLEDVKIGAVSF